MPRYHRTMWSYADIADVLRDGLAEHAAALDREQAVYGMDALDEVALHPVLAQALRAGGFEVFREQRYPADRRKRRVSEGQRCDLVLTPAGRPLVEPEQSQTLFEPPDALPPDEAMWIEVKVVHQFTPAGPNHRYSAQLLATVKQDAERLSSDEGILHAAVLLVLFCRESTVADHDLNIWYDRALRRGVPMASPVRREIEVKDRCGNTLCAMALCPVGRL